MYVVGVDLGYEYCGLASVEYESRKLANYMQIETPRASTLEARLKLVYDRLKEQLWVPDIKAVAYENPTRTGAGKAKRHQTNTSVLILHVVLGHLQSLCWERGLLLESVEPQELKKTLAGSGDASKDDVRKAVRLYTGCDMREHEADATSAAFTLVQRLKKRELAGRLHA